MTDMLITDWIPCTMPPLRDGEYDVMDKYGHHWRANFTDGKWTHVRLKCPMEATTHKPEEYQWRGRRMWVLRSKAILGHGVLYLSNAPQSEIWICKIELARGFETYDEAVAVAKDTFSHSEVVLL